MTGITLASSPFVMAPSNRQQEIVALEQDAELLAVEQLDLLAQLEQQLRAVRHTMTHISKLRNAKFRVGPELSNGERETTLATLATEVTALEQQLDAEHGCCGEMQKTIARMRERVANLRRLCPAASDRLTAKQQPEST